MTATRTPPRLSAWRDALDDQAHSLYGALPGALRSRVRRLGYALVPILQCGISAGLAWFIAFDLIGHEHPFFAPIAAAIALGTGMGKRIRRSAELVLGVVLGVGLGDLLVREIGSGAWQIALVVVIAMTVAVFLDAGPILATQSASSAILVATLLPPGSVGGYERMLDTAVGGGVAIAAMALVPVNPLRRARREAAALIGVASAVLHEVQEGLSLRDAEAIRSALQDARGTQPAIDGLHEQLGGARELVLISPVYWRQRSELVELERLLNPLDNGIRNIRVLARRAIVAVEDSVEVDDALIRLVARLGDALEMLGHMVYDGAGVPGSRSGLTAVEVTRELRSVAAGARRELVDGKGLTETVVLAQIRSVLVDMLQVAGLSKISALATLPPTVTSPAITPEVVEQWPDDARDGESRGARRSPG